MKTPIERKTPAAVQEWLKSRATAKRIRRAEKPGASRYAKGNVR